MDKLTSGEFEYISRLLRSNAAFPQARGVAAREKARVVSIERKLKQLR